MSIASPSSLREQAAQQKTNNVDDAMRYCEDKIRDAMARNVNSVRICTGIEYGDSDYMLVDSALEAAGYRVDSDVSLRHGHIVDVAWDD